MKRWQIGAGVVAAMAVGSMVFVRQVVAVLDGDPATAKAEAAKRHAEFMRQLEQSAPVPASAPAVVPVPAVESEPVSTPPPEPVAPPAPKNVTREISFREMAECQMDLQSSLKDPDSYKELSKTRENGGVIHYTATNSFGGRVKASHHCLLGINMQ